MSKIQVINATVRQTSTVEERRQAVAESYKSGLGLNAFAKRIGISPASLSNWRKKYKHTLDLPSKLPAVYHRQTSGMPAATSEAPPMAVQEIMEPFNMPARVTALEQENQALRAQVFKLQAFVGRKVFELEFKDAGQTSSIG